MGIKESFPTIRGKTIKFNTEKEKNFFQRSRDIIKIYSYKNTYSDYNLKKSLELKTFHGPKILPKKDELKDINWIEYLNIHLPQLYNKYQAFWVRQLLKYINNNNILIYENKFFSNIFYHEYQLFTIPKSISKENNNISNKENIKNKEYEQETKETQETEPEFLNIESKYDKNYLEIEVIDNLGGSILNIAEDEIVYQYKEKRKRVKNYIHIIKDHLYYYDEHPFHKVIIFFNEEFGQYIKQKLKNLEDNLNKDVINKDMYESDLKNFEEEITFCLQEVISRIHSALKLFYSTTIDLQFLEDEKDDLFNLVISAFFRIGNLYKNIVELYTKRYDKEFIMFQEGLIKLRDVNPKVFGLNIKFCSNLYLYYFKIYNSLKVCILSIKRRYFKFAKRIKRKKRK